MSDAVTIALIAGVPITLTAVAGLIVSIRNGRRAKLTGDKTDQIYEVAKTKFDELTEELKVAKGHVTELRKVVDNYLDGKKTEVKD